MAITTEITSERRLVNRLKNYWDMLRGESDIPNFAKFNSAQIADMWQNCMSFSVTLTAGRKKMYQCNFVGENVSAGFGKDLKDRYVSSHDKRILPGANLTEAMDDAVDNRLFVLSAGQFVNFQNKIVKYRDCIMPFGDDNNVTNVVVGISWKAF